jgi:hypothetical protein
MIFLQLIDVYSPVLQNETQTRQRTVLYMLLNCRNEERQIYL